MSEIKFQTKHISQNWAIDMIAEEPVIPYDGRRVMCDGTHGGVAKEQVPKVYSHFGSFRANLMRIESSYLDSVDSKYRNAKRVYNFHLMR